MPTSIDVFAKAREHERLEQLRAARELDALPYFRILEGPTLPVVEMEGKRRIMLGSNNYLGLTGDERVKQGALDAMYRYGTGLTGSRFLNGTIDLHLELERELADWLDAEAALVFTTGHQANLGALGTILGPSDTVVADSGDHASILDGCLLSRAKLRPFRHGRMDRLEHTLQKAAGDGGGILVVVDGVFSMEGDVAPLPEIVELCRRFGARLMVDEAHALGVLGPEGRGLCAEAGVVPDALVGTFGKAFGAAGAFVAGCPTLRSWLWNRARSFVFSTAISPATAAAARANVEEAANRPALRRTVAARAAQLRAGLAEGGIAPLGRGHIVPWVIGDAGAAVRAAAALAGDGILAGAVRPPTVPPGTARIRFAVSAAHTEDDVVRAVRAAARALACARA